MTVEPTVRRILWAMVARMNNLPEDLLAMADEDFDGPPPGHPAYQAHSETVGYTTAAILEVFKEQLEQQIGRTVSLIRDAEGIDADQVDQILGVDPWDL